MNPWIGMFVPAGAPRAIVDRLNAEMNRILASPDVVQKLEALALDPWTSTPEEFNARLKVDYEKYGKLIRLTGAKIE
jgi:tripartite-type tricarboxylate transporter receptor subunit TctC